MNTKLLLSTVLTLFVAQGLSAYNWIVNNHTPFNVTVTYKIAGKNKTVTINSGASYTHDSGAILCQGIEVKGIQALLGNSFFGGSNAIVLLKDEFKAGKAHGTTWDLFIEQKLESKILTGLTVSFTPTELKFYLVRKSFLQQGGGVVNATGWYTPAGASIASK